MFGNEAILGHLENDLRIAHAYLKKKKEKFLKVFKVTRTHLDDFGGQEENMTALAEFIPRITADQSLNTGEFSAKCAQLINYIDQER